jgi:hypothetical protein
MGEAIDTVYYHGGVPGKEPGDVLLSRKARGAGPLRPTGIDDRQRYSALWGGSTDITRRLYRADRVYVTTSFDWARSWAAIWPGGDVYRVAPSDPIESDPSVEWRARQAGKRNLCFICPSATILAVERRDCHLNAEETALLLDYVLPAA